ncbi:MAG TPA: heme o synthase [Gemmatimonadales bacterium]|nr:heme o synthase [Gemmatimonadales bacterium]
MTLALPLRGAPRPVQAADLLALTKPRITQLVVMTTAAGFVLASPDGVAFGRLAHALAGTALVAGGTNALNQWWERGSDALMPRTRARPLPAGRLDPRVALGFGWGIALAGIGYLAGATNPLTALLAAATLLSYVFAYTPLKRRSPAALGVGAVPGALPIVGGWTAAGGALDAGAAALFLILFLWQLPHFLALGWLYRGDYRRAGLRLAGVADDTGAGTARRAALGTVALVIASLVPVGLGPKTAILSFGGVLALGAWLTARAVGFARAPTDEAARRLFFASVVYLPALLGLLVADHIAR